MKKLLFGLIAIIGLGLTTNAQVHSHAIGLRLGGGDEFATAISYQHGLKEATRLEFDLGFSSHNEYSAWAITGLHQWVWNIEEGFNWYAGVGGKVGSRSWSSKYEGSGSNGAFMAIDGDIGIEYIWDFGLQVSLDLRPELGLINRSGFPNYDLGLGIRYVL
jgi:hypothetical protein